jgi:hypothetical protein
VAVIHQLTQRQQLALFTGVPLRNHTNR